LLIVLIQLHPWLPLTRELSAKLTEGENSAPNDQHTHIHRRNFGQYPNCKFLLLSNSRILNRLSAVHLSSPVPAYSGLRRQVQESPCLGTIKVCNVVSNCFLPLKTHRIVSQKVIPQFSFPRSHIFSQHLSQRDVLFIVDFHVLSLRQKSKIFATSLISGRLWRDTKPHMMHYTERCME